jgi:hypothetical protein
MGITGPGRRHLDDPESEGNCAGIVNRSEGWPPRQEKSPPALRLTARRSVLHFPPQPDLRSLQSRITVSGETFSTSAVSSTLRQPKKRNSIAFALLSSIAARDVREFPKAVAGTRRYSARSDLTGSIREARHAGKAVADAATPRTMPITTAKVTGSSAVTP